MAKLSPIGNVAQFINGIPANGAKLFTYAAGSSTKQTTYTDDGGLTQQANPIILDSRGEPTQPIWLTEGLSYKFVFTASTDSDPPVSPIWDVDDITGINDASVSIDQWVDSGITPTYVNATQFTLPGDQTSAFQVNRRIKATVTAGTVYGYISVSAYAALTTVTVVLDSGTLDSGLSAISYGLLTSTDSSIPASLYTVKVLPSVTTLSTAEGVDVHGTNTNDNAAAGYVGEYMSSQITAANAAALTTNTALQLTSLSLTAGDWDVEGHVAFVSTAASFVNLTGWIDTSGTFSNDMEAATRVVYQPTTVLNTPASGVPKLAINRRRFSLSATTSVYLYAQAAFTTAAATSFGFISARRVR